MCAVLFAPPVSPGAEPRGADDEFVPLVTLRRFAVGMTCAELRAAAGAPDAMLDANVWVYWNIRARGLPDDQNYDALLVVIANDRVKLFKFCASAPVKSFLARQEAAARNRNAAQ